MTLIQKLPLGFAIAAFMMMSSCSQEDAQIVQPLTEKTNEHSSLKVAANPTIPATNGSPGQQVMPVGWIPSAYNSGQTVCGTSTITNLWGSPYLPWIKPLPLPGQSAANNAGNFITFIYQKKFLDPSSSTFSTVRTKIKNLVPGKQYAFTFKVSSTILVKNGETTQYAPAVDVEVPGTISSPTDHTYINLVGKEAEWVTKTITFVAQDPEVQVNVVSSFDAQYYNSHSKFFHYSHIYVPQNAVVEVP